MAACFICWRGLGFDNNGISVFDTAILRLHVVFGASGSELVRGWASEFFVWIYKLGRVYIQLLDAGLQRCYKAKGRKFCAMLGFLMLLKFWIRFFD